MEAGKEMQRNKGTLFGVGVGPGDPELLTLKALRILDRVGWIAFPGKEKEKTMAYRIIEPMVKDPKRKQYLDCPIEMTKDGEVLDRNYEQAAKKIADVLETGEDVAYITIGDPTVYATYMYIHQRVRSAGFQAEIINGIPSFCAAAGRIGVSLAERSEQLHIVPASYQIEEALQLPGNKVLMKTGSSLKNVKELLQNFDADVYMVERCTLPDERIFLSADEIDDNAGYMSVIMVKEK